LLHPEVAGARHPAWLHQETEPFREGYLATIADVTAVVSGGTVPIRLSLPERSSGRRTIEAQSP
jgi:hypothetical protein